MAWMLLIAAGVCEVGWAVGLRFTDGFTRAWPTVVVVALMLASFVLLARSSRMIPPAVAYSVWVGIGILGTWVVSILWLKDEFRAVQLAWVGVIATGLIGLKLSTPERVVEGEESGVGLAGAESDCILGDAKGE